MFYVLSEVYILIGVETTLKPQVPFISISDESKPFQYMKTKVRFHIENMHDWNGQVTFFI